MEAQDMADIYVLQPDGGSGIKPGHSLTITKVIDVTDVYEHYNGMGTVVRDHEGKRYYLSTEWDWKFTTPADWPPKPGDVWEAGGVKYMGMEYTGEIALEPVSRGLASAVHPDQYDKF